jgi:hypothetical protein
MKKQKIKVWVVSTSQKEKPEPFDSLDVALQYLRGAAKVSGAKSINLESKAGSYRY